MNAPHSPIPLPPPLTGEGVREIPGCIAKREADADYAWFSSRHLLVLKDGDTISLSPDDLRRLFAFVDANKIEEQL